MQMCDTKVMEEPLDMRDEHGASPTLVTCPACNQPGFLGTWPWILSTRDEHAMRLLLEGNLFKYRCPVCETQTTIAYDCMYHDVAHRGLMLYLTGMLSDEQCLEMLDKVADRAQWESGTQTPAYKRRIVRSPFEFCEKARIWDAGYDDRVIELMKVALKRGMIKDGSIGVRDALVYERTLDNGGISFIVFGEQPGDVVGVPKGYEYLEKILRESTEPLDNEYIFDSVWAEHFLP